MFSALRKPCCSPSNSKYACITPLASSASTILRLWSGVTMRSSEPWKVISGSLKPSRWKIGERARYSASSGGPTSDTSYLLSNLWLVAARPAMSLTPK